MMSGLPELLPKTAGTVLASSPACVNACCAVVSAIRVDGVARLRSAARQKTARRRGVISADVRCSARKNVARRRPVGKPGAVDADSEYCARNHESVGVLFSRPKITLQLLPPKPNEFDSAMLMSRSSLSSNTVFGQSGSTSVVFNVPGTNAVFEC